MNLISFAVGRILTGIGGAKWFSRSHGAYLSKKLWVPMARYGPVTVACLRLPRRTARGVNQEQSAQFPLKWTKCHTSDIPSYCKTQNKLFPLKLKLTHPEMKYLRWFFVQTPNINVIGRSRAKLEWKLVVGARYWTRKGHMLRLFPRNEIAHLLHRHRSFYCWAFSSLATSRVIFAKCTRSSECGWGMRADLFIVCSASE